MDYLGQMTQAVYSKVMDYVDSAIDYLGLGPSRVYSLAGTESIRYNGKGVDGLVGLLDPVFFAKRRAKTSKGHTQRHKRNPCIVARGQRIPRENGRDGRPLVQRVMEMLGVNRKVAQRYIQNAQ